MTPEELNNWAIKILKENKILLKRNDLDAFYEKMRDEWGNGYLSSFTQFFLSRGANPLSYFKKSIPEWCFANLKIGEKNISINEGIKTVGYAAFYGCKDLEEITFPSSLEEIGSSVFKGCKNLRKVTFKSVPKLKGAIFSNNPRLTDIYLPKPKDDYETTKLNWTINHLFYKDIDPDKLNIHYI